jgi:predicted acylesterase/phospholipase RssA
MAKTRHFKNCLGVFQGGGCKALAFVGAFREATECGVFFSQIAGTSAGSIIAALVAAGASPEYLENAILDTKFDSFKQPVDDDIAGENHAFARLISFVSTRDVRLTVRFLRRLGLFSSSQIESWVETHLRTLLKVSADKRVTFDDLNLPLHIVATEIGTASPMIWSTESTPAASVSYAVRCSCTIPVYFQPVDKRYVDGGVLSNLPAFVLNRSSRRSYEKVLCFAFEADRSQVLNGELDAKSYLLKLISTIIDGSTAIQSGLQEELHSIEITGLPLGTVDFDKITPESVKAMFAAGKVAAEKFFRSETTKVRARYENQRILLTEPETLNHIVREELGKGDEVTISLPTTRYVYNMFPTLLYWRMQGVALTFITKTAETQVTAGMVIHEKFRRIILQGLGAHVHELDELSIEGVFLRRQNQAGNAIVFDEHRAEEYRACFAMNYDKTYDASAIRSMFPSSKVRTSHPIASTSNTFRLVKGGENLLMQRLKTIDQYSDDRITIDVEEIDIQKIVFLTKFVKSYKYSQIERLFRIYDLHGFNLFEPINMQYDSALGGVIMPITPPVAEEHGGKFYLFEGNSRLTYMIKELNVTRVRLVVVRNVSAAFPTSGHFNSSQLLISDEDRIGGNRYKNWNRAHYREIEEAARRPRYYVQS